MLLSVAWSTCTRGLTSFHDEREVHLQAGVEQEERAIAHLKGVPFFSLLELAKYSSIDCDLQARYNSTEEFD